MCTAWRELPHAILLVLAAEHPMRLSWVIEARMGATLRHCTLPHHFAYRYGRLQSGLSTASTALKHGVCDTQAKCHCVMNLASPFP